MHRFVVSGERPVCAFCTHLFFFFIFLIIKRLKTELKQDNSNGSGVMRLSETLEAHLMRGIDTTGNRVLELKEWLDFLVPKAATDTTDTAAALLERSEVAAAQSDLELRSVAELVKLLEIANQKLVLAGVVDGGGSGSGDCNV